MKKIIFNCFILLTLLTVVQSCKPDKVPTLKAPTAVTANFAGTWKITQVTQFDGSAVSKNFPFQKMDLTNLFHYSDFTLTLNSDGLVPTTFSIVQGGAPSVIRVLSGNWSFDNPTYPSALIFAGLTDTVKVNLDAYPTAASPTLPVTINKYAVTDLSKKSALVYYNYIFTKQ